MSAKKRTNHPRKRGGKPTRAPDQAGGAKRRGRAQGNRRRSRRPRPTPAEGAGFWGLPEQLPPAETDVQLNDDPSAVPRSLGPPPLPGHEVKAEDYFTLVYRSAVGTAAVLAAAGGLIDPTALSDQS